MARMIDCHCLLLLSIAVLFVSSQNTDLVSVPRVGTPAHSSVRQHRRALTEDTCVPDNSVEACEPCTASYQCKDTFCCPYMKLCSAGPCSMISGRKFGDCSPNCHAQGEPGSAEVQKCSCHNDFPLDWMTCDDGSKVGPAGVEDPNFEPPPPDFGLGCTDDCIFSNLIDNGDCEDGGHRSTWDACALGSDCSDCGAREVPADTGCADDCKWSNQIGNGRCDDGGPGSVRDHCDLGSDCTDCGPRGTETTDSAAEVCNFAVVWHESGSGAKGAVFSSLELADAKYDELFDGAYATRLYDQLGGIGAEYGNMSPTKWKLLDDWRLSYACCEDDPDFIDSLNYPCVDWVGYNCFDTTPYTSKALEDVRSSCPATCGLCPEVDGGGSVGDVSAAAPNTGGGGGVTGDFGCKFNANLDDDMRQAILDDHNKIRRSLGIGSSMLELTWDCLLEEVAQNYINSLGNQGFNHNSKRTAEYADLGGGDDYVGENWFSGEGFEAATKWSVFKWPVKWGGNGCSEQENFFGKLRIQGYEHCRGVVGHFTQVMWMSSARVGCGWTSNGGTTCNYAPGGNMGSQHPFDGEPLCSDCPDAYPVCNDGLCAAEADESESEAPVPEPEPTPVSCKDFKQKKACKKAKQAECAWKKGKCTAAPAPKPCKKFPKKKKCKKQSHCEWARGECSLKAAEFAARIADAAAKQKQAANQKAQSSTSSSIAIAVLAVLAAVAVVVMTVLVIRRRVVAPSVTAVELEVTVAAE